MKGDAKHWMDRERDIAPAPFGKQKSSFLLKRSSLSSLPYAIAPMSTGHRYMPLSALTANCLKKHRP